MTKRSRLQDVANLAGVSIGTASRVLNNKPNVMPETRDRVLSAAETLQYQHTGRAMLDTPETLATIGVLATLIPDEYAVSNPFYGSVISGIDVECREQQVKLVYATFSRAVHATPSAWPLPLHDPDIDGLLLIGQIPAHVIDLVSEQTNKPIVLVDAHARDYDMIVADNVIGAYHAVRYLIEHGHRHIALLGTRPNAFSSFLQRREGYLCALKNHGISDVYIGESSHLSHEVYNATIDILQQHPQITAIFVCLDLVASNVIQAARDLGREVPDDVSVIGFDNLPLVASMSPPLTTMHVDIPLMGALGVQQLLERIDNPDRVPVHIMLRPQIVVRDSVRSLND